MCTQHRQSSIGTRLPRSFGPLVIVLVAMWVTAGRGEDQPTSPPPQAVLNLANGGYAAGEIRPSTQPAVLRWQAESFVSPFDFAWNEVNAVAVAAAGHAGQTRAVTTASSWPPVTCCSARCWPWTTSGPSWIYRGWAASTFNDPTSIASTDGAMVPI